VTTSIPLAKHGSSGDAKTAISKTSKALEEGIPNLASEGYEVTSNPSDFPNCIGWALRDYTGFWDPDAAQLHIAGYRWLPYGPYDWEISTVSKIFEMHGYSDCRLDDGLEPGFEKIAIYVDHEQDIHVARQQESGKWTSKLGTKEDLDHYTLKALEADTESYLDACGKVVQIMKRFRR
jgi:hypothetical protein